METLYCNSCKCVEEPSKKRGIHVIVLAVLWLFTITALFHYWLGLMFLIAALFYSATTKHLVVDASGSCDNENKNHCSRV